MKYIPRHAETIMGGITMAIIDKIKAKAKSDVKHIVLPEGEEIRNVQAAVMIRDQGLAKLTLLGNPDKVKEVAAFLQKILCHSSQELHR